MKCSFLIITGLFFASVCCAQTNKILETGNVGIGTINPQAKLDVKSSLLKNEYGIVQPTINVYSNDEPQIGVGGAIGFGGRTGNSNPEYAFAYLTGAKETTQFDNYAGYFAIRTVSGGENGETMSANYERFRISANGNVGIGTSTPNAKLSVNGNIRAKEIKLETANWPDYVFEESYPLPTLQEIERHIKDKGHLSGIPSAAEVKINGIDLGEMNAKLLKKIEELTLHLIDMEKKIKRQEEKINSLTFKIK